jgi:hypothetical protein
MQLELFAYDNVNPRDETTWSFNKDIGYVVAEDNTEVELRNTERRVFSFENPLNTHGKRGRSIEQDIVENSQRCNTVSNNPYSQSISYIAPKKRYIFG